MPLKCCHLRIILYWMKVTTCWFVALFLFINQIISFLFSKVHCSVSWSIVQVSRPWDSKWFGFAFVSASANRAFALTSTSLLNSNFQHDSFTVFKLSVSHFPVVIVPFVSTLKSDKLPISFKVWLVCSSLDPIHNLLYTPDQNHKWASTFCYQVWTFETFSTF